MPIFDKLKIKSNFNKAADSYDQFANLQKIVADNLVKIIDKKVRDAERILDLGSGTGFIAKSILTNWTDKKKTVIQLDIAKNMFKKNNPENIFNVNADIEFLPFKPQIFDLIISSLAFQWLDNLEQVIIEIAKIIKPQGSLAFSIIGTNSLKELKTSCQNCAINLSVNPFVQKFELEKVISKKFDYQVTQEVINLKYHDLLDLLKSIKSIGAGYSFNKNFLSRKDFAKISNFYLKNFSSDNRVSCTWQIFYVICKLK